MNCRQSALTAEAHEKLIFTAGTRPAARDRLHSNLKTFKARAYAAEKQF